MYSKKYLIRVLELFTQELRETENTEEQIFEAIQRIRMFYPFWDNEYDSRLHSIENKIDSLIDRPITSCNIISSGTKKAAELMTGRGKSERDKGVQYLSDWIGSPTEITIADPYLIKNINSISVTDYKNSLQQLLPSSLKEIELFIGPNNHQYQKACIATWFNHLCAEREIQLKVYHQKEIHDRVWLKNNNNDALVVGTSFNGLGNKCAFLLSLDDNDTASFSDELHRIRKEYTCSNQV